ncbi:MAG: hypothetical protein ACR2JJ_04795 [Sphingomicrobium sp.]
MLEVVQRYLAGEAPLPRVFGRDMLLIGTVVNLVAGGIALVAFSMGLSLWAWLVIHLSPVPYNALLCVSVWRSAARQECHWSELARVGAVIWFAVMLVV